MNKKIASKIVIGIVLTLIIGIIFYLQISRKDRYLGSILSANESWQIYQNDEYKLYIEYPRIWRLSESKPKIVTTSYEKFNYEKNKYSPVFIEEDTNFTVGFIPDVNIMPYRGNEGYFTVEVFNGNLEKLFDQTYERSGYIKHNIETGKSEMTFEKYREDFFGESINIKGNKAYKSYGIGQIPDSKPYKVATIMIDRGDRVVIVQMGYVDNIDKLDKIYEKMLASLNFLE